MTLRPMVLMVCEPCRAGKGGAQCEPGCVFWAYCAGAIERPLAPARSRDEMVREASGWLGGNGTWAESILNAAIPGLLEGES